MSHNSYKNLPNINYLPKCKSRTYAASLLSVFIEIHATIYLYRNWDRRNNIGDHAIKYSETAFSNSNVNYFWSIKTLPKSSKSCGCKTFRVLKYLRSIFLHYTQPFHMILSRKKCSLLLNCVSIESQKRTSVLQIRRNFSPTRNMTRINVGLALILVKRLLS